MPLKKIKTDSVKLIKLAFFVALLLILSIEITAKSKNVYSNPSLGFEITKLNSWYFVSPKASIESTKQENLRKKIDMNKVSVPIVTISTKSQVGPVTPSVEIRARSSKRIKGLNPKYVMERFIIPGQKKIFYDVSIVQKPTEVTVSGFESAYSSMKFTYRLKDGRSFPVFTQQWLVFTNDIYFIITTNIAQNESKVLRDEIDRIVGSIRIDQ